MENLAMQLAIPTFIFLMLLEFLLGYFQKKKYYALSDTITNLNIGIGNQVVGALTKGAVFLVFYKIYNTFTFFNLSNAWWVWVLCFVLYDFIFYWAHRWGHEINFFWGAHVVHHQSEEYNLSVALRQPWFHHLISFFLFIPLPLLGFNPIIIGVVSLVSTLYQFWIHTKGINKLPKPIEFIFNTPSHHRVHHAVNPKYIDKNHGAVLIIWDRIFGTFQIEEEAPVYGITTQFESLNPAWANFEYYVALWKLFKKYPAKQKIKAIFAKPGWTPDGANPKELILKTNLSRKKFSVNIPLGLKVYTLVQFAFITWGLVAYIGHYNELSLFLKLFFAFLLLLSVVVSGGILEKKKWVFFAEYVRLVGVAFTISTFYYFQYINWFTVMLIFTSIAAVGFAVWFSISLAKNFKYLLLDSY